MDEAIVAAAVDVVAEVGYKVATLEMIASRAGVGTATIYRRYSTKSALIGAALKALAEEFIPPRTGDVRDDLAVLVHQVSSGMNSRPLGRVLAAMSFTEPELFELGWSTLARPRRDVLEGAVTQAISAGQLRRDLDVPLFLDVLSAVPVWSQLVRPGEDFSMETAYAVVDLLLVGAAPPDEAGIQPDRGDSDAHS
ncbi:MAG TPA: TetR/AcrR family transcriptional regulator [Amycolatopsis sp.]|nr:TetR/AcrR family transcriptional regulator [Polyangia bacterium]HVW40971.1 TetR/AcrR family transcriptional regulator [Amycolatopsis sp.]